MGVFCKRGGEVIKTTDLRPCDNCGGKIAPIFYRLEIKIRQLMIDRTAVNEVLGTTQILGGNLGLGSMMSPDREATIELPGYKIDEDLFLCQECVMGIDRPAYSVSPVVLMVGHEMKNKD